MLNSLDKNQPQYRILEKFLGIWISDERNLLFLSYAQCELSGFREDSFVDSEKMPGVEFRIA